MFKLLHYCCGSLSFQGLRFASSTPSTVVLIAATEWLLLALGHPSVAKKAGARDAEFVLSFLSECFSRVPDNAEHIVRENLIIFLRHPFANTLIESV